MSNWRDRLTAAPLWVLFVYFAVAFGVLSLLPIPRSPSSSLHAVFGGLFFGFFMTIWVALVRSRDRRAIGIKRLADPVGVERALRTGEAPADPSQDKVLLGLIERRRAQLHWASKFGSWLFGGAALVSLLFGLTTTDPWLLVFGGLYFVLAVVSRFSSTRGAERLGRLEAMLRSRSES